jgi:hypothetical protein
MIEAMRQGLLVVLCLALLAADPAGAALPRSEVDRLDDVRGPQIHVVYAIPSDGEDRRLDENGSIEGSVGMFQSWLAGQTGGPNLRVDTYQGVPDVSFHRLSKTSAEVASQGPNVVREVEESLHSAGFRRPNRIYAVYYDGLSTYACGGAFWPPEIRGDTVAMYLRGEIGTARCAHFGIPRSSGTPSYWEFAMLHDILHGLGIVGQCAPHHHLVGHVSDFVNDLMYAGPGGWELPPTLDVGRDDYYGHGRADCPDLARSPYLSSNPPPPPVLAVKSFVATQRARPGKTIDARLEVALDEEPLSSGTARCTAKLGTRALQPIGVSFAGSAALCRWRVPGATKGKRLTASVTATNGSLSAVRRFSRVIG